MPVNVIYPLRIDPETLAALQTIARAEGRTNAAAARWAIRQYAATLTNPRPPAGRKLRGEIIPAMEARTS